MEGQRRPAGPGDVQPAGGAAGLRYPAHPFIPQSAAEVLRQIGACETCSTWESAAGYGALSHTVTVSRGENLFPRIDAEKALSELEEAAAAAKKAALPDLEVEPQLIEKVDFDTFARAISGPLKSRPAKQ